MTAALEGGEWSAARPGRTLPPGKTRYPLYRRLGGTQGQSGRAENLAPPGFDPRTVQPVVSRYTDWATRPIGLIYTLGISVQSHSHVVVSRTPARWQDKQIHRLMRRFEFNHKMCTWKLLRSYDVTLLRYVDGTNCEQTYSNCTTIQYDKVASSIAGQQQLRRTTNAPNPVHMNLNLIVQICVA